MHYKFIDTAEVKTQKLLNISSISQHQSDKFFKINS